MKNQQSNIVAIDINTVKSCMLQVRGQHVLLDRDVAALYGVETRIINQAVKNNPEKFPAGYVTELSSDELTALRSKFLTANVSSKSRALPKVFTERGLYMLATILKGERAERGAKQSSYNASSETNGGMIKWNAMIIVDQKSLSDSSGDDSLLSVRTRSPERLV